MPSRVSMKQTVPPTCQLHGLPDAQVSRNIPLPEKPKSATHPTRTQSAMFGLLKILPLATPAFLHGMSWSCRRAAGEATAVVDIVEASMPSLVRKTSSCDKRLLRLDIAAFEFTSESCCPAIAELSLAERFSRISLSQCLAGPSIREVWSMNVMR